MTGRESDFTQHLATYAGKRVFLTGHTGFKGSWLSIWLHDLGAQVFGYSLEPNTEPNNFDASDVKPLLEEHTVADIRNRERLTQAIQAANPDVIFHLAAQPLVRESYSIPHETHEINYMGTCNVLEAVRTINRPCAVVVITTDKCYENQEQLWGYREIDRLGGHDPYSASKAAAEIVTSSYRDSFFPPSRIAEHGIRVASARAGNVIGGGDWARDRIVPDIVNSIVSEKVIPIRSPNAIRPWQHVLEPLSGYLLLGSRLMANADPRDASAWNFGPGLEGNQTVLSLVKQFCEHWGAGSWKCEESAVRLHETNVLRLSIEKAATQLNWRPTWDFSTTVEKTVNWYRRFASGEPSLREACLADIHDFASAAAAEKAASSEPQFALR